MSFTQEQMQQLLDKYQQLKDTLINIEKKYSLSYYEPTIDFPPSLNLQKLTYTPKTPEQLNVLATKQVEGNHLAKVRIFEQNYMRTMQTLLTKKNNINNQQVQKLAKLQRNYSEKIKNLRRRLVNNGLVFSSVNAKVNAQTLDEYNSQVDELQQVFLVKSTRVDEEIDALDERYAQGMTSLNAEYQTRLSDEINDLTEKERKKQEQVQKYNTSLDEKETKYQASCERSIQYARQAENERALNAARLYAELGESGVEAQKVSEKYNYSRMFFSTWKRSEAQLVAESDGFLSAQLGQYYTALMDYISTLSD